ncbi:hypothetical protein HZC31_06765 [Candidatus Woesearchaeota archaeon]|nr:hypothetical protein [Candidatus Woesearchaeota archaeon]
MTIPLATQYNFTGTYTLKVDPRGRIAIPVDIARGLEQKVRATIIADPDVQISEYGVQYRGQWLYVSREQTSQRKRIREFIDKIKQEDPTVPDIIYKSTLLDAKLLLDPADEAKKIQTRHWQYSEDGQKREYTTLYTNLDMMMGDIRRREELGRRPEPERIQENIYCSTQAFEIDAQNRICFGKNHEIVREALQTTGREIVLLGMQDMLVLITPAQREALQKREPAFLREGQLVHLIRS